MNEFLLIVIIGMIGYLISVRDKEKLPQVEKTMIDDCLMEMVGKFCEISLKEWLVYIDCVYTIKGTILDIDDDWIAIEVVKKNTKKVEVIRKTLISEVKEIRQKIEEDV